ncbi:hypothetical protein SK128_015333 [Halocaridina rubra]|uniref:Uncharacterized protein n=1 Tax=Halocaridina rubra TaxID=373956 RepID=A0AAN8X6N4_HALRR
MTKLSLADRCVIFVLIIIGISTLSTGVSIFLKGGYSEGALVAIACGGNLLIIVIIISVITKCSNHDENSDEGARSPPLAQEDLPPNYRLTWRKEFMEKSPEHLKAYLESGIDFSLIDEPPRGRIPFIKTSDLYAGVHGPTSVSSSTSSGIGLDSSSHSSSSGISFVIPAVINTNEVNIAYEYDEGLPSYEEAQTQR